MHTLLRNMCWPTLFLVLWTEPSWPKSWVSYGLCRTQKSIHIPLIGTRSIKRYPNSGHSLVPTLWLWVENVFVWHFTWAFYSLLFSRITIMVVLLNITNFAIIYGILVKNMYGSTSLTFLHWPWLSLLLRFRLSFELLKDDVVLGMIEPAVPLKSTDENIIYETMNIRISHIGTEGWRNKCKEDPCTLAA